MSYSFSSSSGLARLLDLTVNQLLDGILIVNDVSRRVTYFNEKFIRMWGIPEDLAKKADDYAQDTMKKKKPKKFKKNYPSHLANLEF